MNGGLAKTTNTAHAYEDPNLFGKSFKLFSCLASIQISPWHLTSRLHGLYFGVVPPDTSSLTECDTWE